MRLFHAGYKRKYNRQDYCQYIMILVFQTLPGYFNFEKEEKTSEKVFQKVRGCTRSLQFQETSSQIKKKLHALCQGQFMEKVSISMTTCNGERFLRDQLDSIFSQTCQDIEVVVCDDCSTDGTNCHP